MRLSNILNVFRRPLRDIPFGTQLPWSEEQAREWGEELANALNMPQWCADCPPDIGWQVVMNEPSENNNSRGWRVVSWQVNGMTLLQIKEYDNQRGARYILDPHENKIISVQQTRSGGHKKRIERALEQLGFTAT